MSHPERGVRPAVFASEPNRWVLHRMSSQKPTIVGAPPEPVGPSELGLVVAEFNRPRDWRFAAAPKLEQDPRSARFKRYRPDSQVCPDETSVDGWLDSARASRDGVESMAISPEDANTEWDHFNKLGVLLGKLPYWFVGAQGPKPRTDPLPRRFLQILDHVVAQVAKASEPVDEIADEPTETNGGFPTFVGGLAAKVVGGLLADVGANEVMRNAKAVCANLGLPEECALAFGLAGRSGATFKDRPRLKLTSEGWVVDATWKGYYQRNRVVQMSCMATNQSLRPLYAALRSAQSRLPGLWHTGTNEYPAELAGFKYQLEIDFSGYDTSVQREVQTAVAAAFRKHLPHLTKVIDIWEMAENLPLLTPSWSLTDSKCAIVQALGGTHSGVKTTSVTNTIIALVVTLYAGERTIGIDPMQWPNDRHSWVHYHLGDDARVGCNESPDPDTWAAACLELGITAKVISGYGFLGRKLIPGVGSLPIAARLIQQTMSNEHEQVGPTWAPLLQLGFAARWAGAEHMPSPLYRFAWETCRKAAWVQEMKFSSPSEIATYVANDPDGKIKGALLRSEGADWLQAEAEQVEHSVSAQETVRMAERLGLTPGSLSTGRLLTHALKQLAHLPWRERVTLATQGTGQVWLGRVAAANWLHSLPI